MLWLVVQAATLSAFLPSECCPAHTPAVVAEVECDGASHGICPMKAATGEECPMHASGGTNPQRPSADDCVMRALCGAPASALALLIPVAGVLPDTLVLSDLAVVGTTDVTVQALPDIWFILDTPPPRPAA